MALGSCPDFAPAVVATLYKCVQHVWSNITACFGASPGQAGGRVVAASKAANACNDAVSALG